MEMLSNAALLEVETRKAIKASRHKDDVVLSTEDERTKSKKETAESGKTNKNSDDEEEHVEEEYVHDADNVHDDVEKQDDVNMEMKDAEIAVESNVDEEMADATQANAKKIDKRKVMLSNLLSNLETKFEAWTKVDHYEVITEVVQTNVINEVKNQLPKLLPKAVSEFVTPSIERKVRDMLQEYTINPKQHDSRKDPKSTDKSVQAEETVFEVADTDLPIDQGENMSNDDEQPNDEAAPKTDKSRWFKQPQRPHNPDLEWNKGKSVEDGSVQNWLNDMANAEKPPLSFV
ncbi:hypothetical protein Tco_1098001 [Tanacetum coccineum]